MENGCLPYNKNLRKNVFTMISKCITCPMNQTEREYERINVSDKEVVKFHRDGFRVKDDGWINDIFFEQVVTKTTSITNVITHFANCLHHQCNLELKEFDGENCLKNNLLCLYFRWVSKLASILIKRDVITWYCTI